MPTLWRLTVAVIAMVVIGALATPALVISATLFPDAYNQHMMAIAGRRDRGQLKDVFA